MLTTFTLPHACSTPPHPAQYSLSRVVGGPPCSADDYPFILANPPPTLSPQLSMDRVHHFDDSAVTSPVRQLSRLSLMGELDKASAFAEPAGRLGGPPQLHRTSTLPKPPSGKLEKGAWLRQRPGATLFEILQASIVNGHRMRVVQTGCLLMLHLAKRSRPRATSRICIMEALCLA